VSRLERTLNKPIVVLVVGVIAVVLNVLLYFGLFLPRMTPLIAHIIPIGTSLPEEAPSLSEEPPIIATPLEPKPPQSPDAGSPPPELPPLPTPQQQY
jgi:hypothetical protein